MRRRARRTGWSARRVAGGAALVQLAVVVAVGTGVFLATTSSVEASLVGSTRAALAGAVGEGGSVVVSVPDTDGAAAIGADAITASLAPAPVRVASSLRADGVPVDVDGTRRSLLLLADASLPDDAILVSGAWPTEGEAALESRAAAAIGVRTGDTLAVGTSATPVRISGVWRVADPLAARWAGEPAYTSGRDGDAVGPLLLDAADLRAVAPTRTLEWTVTPRTGAVRPADLTVLAARAVPQQIAGRVAAAVPDLTEPPRAHGSLATTADAVRAEADAARALSAVPLLLLLLVAVTAAAATGGVLAQRRSSADALLRARGARARTVRGWDVADAAISALGGGIVGGALGALSTPGGWGATNPLGWTGVAALVLAVVVWTGVTASTLWARPVARTVGVGTCVVAALACVALLRTDAGSAGPLGLVAGPLLVLAGSLLLLGVGQALVRAAPRSRATVRMSRYLARRGIRARRAPLATGSLGIALAGAGAVLTTVLVATAPLAFARADLSRVGADVRVDIAGATALSPDDPSVLGLLPGAGVHTGDAVLASSATVARDDYRLVALPATDARALTGSAFLSTPPAADALAASAVDLAVTISVAAPESAESFDDGAADAPEPASGGVTAVAWVAGASGAVAAVDLQGSATPDGSTVTLTAPLPTSVRKDVRVLAIDLRLADPPSGFTVAASVDAIAGLGAGGEQVGALDPARFVGNENVLSGDRRAARTLVDPAADALPVSLSAVAAERLGLGPGAMFGFSLPAGHTLAARVDRVIPVIPGASSEQAMGADLVELARAALAASDAAPRPNSLWLATDRPADALRAIAQNVDAPWTAAVSDAAGSDALQPATKAAIVGSLTGTVLAAVVVASVLGLLRTPWIRRDEALRSLGLPRAAVRAARRAELGLPLTAGAVGGALIGGGAAALVAPPLVAGAVGVPVGAVGVVGDPVLAAMLAAPVAAVVVAAVVASSRAGSRRAS